VEIGSEGSVHSAIGDHGITVSEVQNDNEPAYRYESARRKAMTSCLHIYIQHRTPGGLFIGGATP
jgi:hypothetical protein